MARRGAMVLRSAKVFVATIGLNLGSAAIAEKLVYYATAPTLSDYYYDTETIRRYDDGDVDVWIKRDASKDKTVSFRTSRSKVRLGCSSETTGLLSIVVYRANGTVIDSVSQPDPDMEPVIPGSVGQTLFDIMCPETDPRKQFNLGVMYKNGRGVAQDYAAAVNWYRKAADQGHAGAQNNLGVMYMNGAGVAQDYVQALKWFNLGAANGNEKAKKNRDELAAAMTSAQITEAQRLAGLSGR
jgi:TPR repeat protein